MYPVAQCTPWSRAIGHVRKETRNAPAERCDPRGQWRVRVGRQLGRRYDRGEPANTRGVPATVTIV